MGDDFIKVNFSVRKAVESRYSVRTYSERKLDSELKKQLLDYAAGIENPFNDSVRVQLLEKELSPNGEKLGTYGVIKGANNYLAVTVKDEALSLEALGYEFEEFVLYSTSLGLGTCWLGGTFKRSAFAEAIEIREGELFPILSPIGYPAEKKSVMERIMRSAVKAEKRLPWEQIFFDGDFSKPLASDQAGDYSFALEMLRLAPSAVNKQPWRILVQGDMVHFFKKHNAAAEKMTVDMQRIDLGIAMAHFDLAMRELEIDGKFEKIELEEKIPSDLKYIVSWKKA